MREKAKLKQEALPTRHRSEFRTSILVYDCFYEDVDLNVIWVTWPSRPEWNCTKLSINYDGDDGYFVRYFDHTKTSFQEMVTMAKQLTWRPQNMEDLKAIGWDFE